MRITRHLITWALILLFIVLFLIFVVWNDIKPDNKKVDITAITTQNTISTGVTAVSILLPLTVGILGFSLGQRKDGKEQIFCASIFFTCSLAIALWNLFRLPGIVNLYNIANDIATGIFEIIQLFCLFWGVIYLVWGSWKMIKEDI